MAVIECLSTTTGTIETKNERYELGAFDPRESAIPACKAIFDEYLTRSYEPGMSANELLDSYRNYGLDPFIVSDEPGIFSACDCAA